MLDRVAATEVGLDGGKFLCLLDLCSLGLLRICVPMVNPLEEAFVVIVHQAVDFPVEALEPGKFHLVQLLNRNAADFSPRSILKCVVIQKLGAQKQTGRQHLKDVL